MRTSGNPQNANFALTEFYGVRTYRRLVDCTFLCIFGRERLPTTQIGDIEHMLHLVYPWSILRAAAFPYWSPTREEPRR